MNINELIEHIKSDNLAEAVAFQLSGVGYVQVKTRDCEKFATVLRECGQLPMTFPNRKIALQYLDNLVKDTLALLFASQQEQAPVPANAPAEGQPDFTCLYDGDPCEKECDEWNSKGCWCGFTHFPENIHLSTNSVDKS